MTLSIVQEYIPEMLATASLYRWRSLISGCEVNVPFSMLCFAYRRNLRDDRMNLITFDPLYLGTTTAEHPRLRYSCGTDDPLYLGM